MSDTPSLKTVEVKFHIVLDLDDDFDDVEEVVKNLQIGDASYHAYVVDDEVLNWKEIK